MSLRKHGLKALGLSFLAVLGLMAIVAPGASATAGKFLVNGSTTLNATAGGEVDLLGVLLVPAVNLEIDCKTFSVTSSSLTASTGEGHATLLYEECSAYAEKNPKGELELHKFCEIYPTIADRTAGTNKGRILAKVRFLVLLHKLKTGGEETIVIAEPLEGSLSTGSFTTILFKECSIPSILITGAIDLLLHLGGDQVKHLVQEASQSIVGLHLLLYGVNHALIDGAVWVFLTGPHAGMKWGIV